MVIDICLFDINTYPNGYGIYWEYSLMNGEGFGCLTGWYNGCGCGGGDTYSQNDGNGRGNGFSYSVYLQYGDFNGNKQ